MTLHDPGESSYSQIPFNKPRHIVFVDEVLGGNKDTYRRGLIHVGRLVCFRFESPLEGPVKVTCELLDPNNNNESNTFVGTGVTLGHALRDLLDNVNEVFPLGGEYDEPPTAA